MASLKRHGGPLQQWQQAQRQTSKKRRQCSEDREPIVQVPPPEEEEEEEKKKEEKEEDNRPQFRRRGAWFEQFESQGGERLPFLLGSGTATKHRDECVADIAAMENRYAPGKEAKRNWQSRKIANQTVVAGQAKSHCKKHWVVRAVQNHKGSLANCGTGPCSATMVETMLWVCPIATTTVAPHQITYMQREKGTERRCDPSG